MTKKHLYASMTWPEVNETITEGRVALIPIGAIEQHGPHLPIDTDNLFVEQICNRAAERAPDALVALPPIHYGFNDHNMDFPGTITIKMQHFMDYCFDVGASLAYHGFRRILYVNGHGSNGPLCNLVARRLVNETEALAGSINHWELAFDAIMSVVEAGPKGVDHACEWETSEYLYLKPELVQMDKALDEYAPDRGGPRWLYPNVAGGATWVYFMNNWSCMSESGINGAATLGTPEKGKVMIETTIERLIEVARDFKALPTAPRVDHRVQPPDSSAE
jgi:creatinine amidohydrolase